jgi:histone deacetylase 1/2
LWHLRLGHPNGRTLKLALKLCNISVSSNENDVSNFCTACCMGKAHRLHSTQSQTIYSQPLELVFSDLWGPAPSTSSGFNYYITFIDAYSRYTWIYLIKSKSEALTIFKQFKNMAELQLGYPLKALQSDWGGGVNLDLSPSILLNLALLIGLSVLTHTTKMGLWRENTGMWLTWASLC